MGNVCSVSISTEDIAGRCCDCTAARANYICKLQENRELRNDVKRKVDVAERQQMKRLDQVQGWLSRVEAMETEVTQLIGDGAENIEEKRFCGSCYPKHCISSYTLGKKVVRKLQQVAALMSDGRFDVVADIVPPAAVEEIPSGTTVGLESTFDRVWRCLEKNMWDDRLIWVGGVRKTTLLTHINNHFLKTSHNFDVVIWVVVSKTPNLDEVQNEIWEKVGFCDDKWKSKSRHLKAKDIWKALNEKRFVMLLDDLWEQMDLFEVGIPPPHQNNKSKLIFTTRSLDLCGQMGAQKKIEVKSLAWKDSWDLFQKYVGEDTLNSDPEIPELAEIVARECCGLPLVIITIGRAMASKVTPQDWKHAIRVLQTSASKFPGMGDPVYPRLKYSYDSLPNKIVQSCFLYCSLFPEDFSIDKEDLIWKWICEGFLDEYDDVDGAKNQGFNIISTLIHACLLEEPSGTNSLKLFEGPSGTNSVKLHDAFECDKQWFFRFMPNLRVLSLNGTNITDLPPDISNLVSLQYLDLSSTRILRFPVGMKNLVKLKRLELAYTFELSSIPRGLISSLSMLQTINLYRCGFKPDGNESLVEELESLKYLIDLRITIHLNSFWMEYCDTLIKFDWAEKGKETVDYSNLNPKVKCFNGLETVTILGCRMLKNLTWLIFAPNLKYLDIVYCHQMEEVIGKGEEDGGNLSPFTNLIQSVWNPRLSLPERITSGCPVKKLPLNSNSARERRVMIEGEEEWWNELEWEDEATLNTFLPNFQALEEKGLRRQFIAGLQGVIVIRIQNPQLLRLYLVLGKLDLYLAHFHTHLVFVFWLLLKAI
ncbi:hypothetical protein AAG906_014699 [Vitis piasezkii]